jgi:hypothetical protein
VLALIALGALVLVALTAPALNEARASGGVAASDETQAQQTQQTKTGKRARINRKYRRIWRKVPNRQKRWAKRTARCESGGDPRAIGGGGKYRGAFQFLRSTWRASPRSPGGDPIRFNYRTQAVVAVALKRRDGAHHWPVCG